MTPPDPSAPPSGWQTRDTVPHHSTPAVMVLVYARPDGAVDDLHTYEWSATGDRWMCYEMGNLHHLTPGARLPVADGLTPLVQLVALPGRYTDEPVPADDYDVWAD